jgi:hypothetical protein
VDHVDEKQISCIPARSYLADEQDDEQDHDRAKKKKESAWAPSIVSNFAAAKLTKVIAVVAQACLESIYSVNRIEPG